MTRAGFCQTRTDRFSAIFHRMQWVTPYAKMPPIPRLSDGMIQADPTGSN